MAQPSTRSELITYAKRQLGAPVLEINVADEQVEDLLDDAIQYFQERHFDGVYPTFLKYKITEDDIKRGRSRDGNTDNVGITTQTATSTIDGQSVSFSFNETSNYLIPKGKHINFNQGERIKKGEYLLDGQPLPHDILRILGIKELTEYFVNQVQEVYRLQGVIINDKHIETILRQMLKKVEVKVSGDSSYLPGEVVDRIKFDNTNEKLVAEGKTPAVGERVLMGITKASLQTDSFISAASFQETTRVLTDAAIRGKVDTLVGLKENVIVGRLVPAGTGSIKNKWNKKALDDDQKFIAEQEKIEQPETPVN